MNLEEQLRLLEACGVVNPRRLIQRAVNPPAVENVQPPQRNVGVNYPVYLANQHPLNPLQVPPHYQPIHAPHTQIPAMRHAPRNAHQQYIQTVGMQNNQPPTSWPPTQYADQLAIWGLDPNQYQHNQLLAQQMAIEQARAQYGTAYSTSPETAVPMFSTGQAQPFGLESFSGPEDEQEGHSSALLDLRASYEGEEYIDVENLVKTEPVEPLERLHRDYDDEKTVGYLCSESDIEEEQEQLEMKPQLSLISGDYVSHEEAADIMMPALTAATVEQPLIVEDTEEQSGALTTADNASIKSCDEVSMETENASSPAEQRVANAVQLKNDSEEEPSEQPPKSTSSDHCLEPSGIEPLSQETPNGNEPEGSQVIADERMKFVTATAPINVGIGSPLVDSSLVSSQSGMLEEPIAQAYVRAQSPEPKKNAGQIIPADAPLGDGNLEEEEIEGGADVQADGQRAQQVDVDDEMEAVDKVHPAPKKPLKAAKRGRPSKKTGDGCVQSTSTPVAKRKKRSYVPSLISSRPPLPPAVRPPTSRPRRAAALVDYTSQL